MSFSDPSQEAFHVGSARVAEVPAQFERLLERHPGLVGPLPCEEGAAPQMQRLGLAPGKATAFGDSTLQGGAGEVLRRRGVGPRQSDFRLLSEQFNQRQSEAALPGDV